MNLGMIPKETINLFKDIISQSQRSIPVDEKKYNQIMLDR
jgi:hypothetical protein